MGGSNDHVASYVSQYNLEERLGHLAAYWMRDIEFIECTVESLRHWGLDFADLKSVVSLA